MTDAPLPQQQASVAPPPPPVEALRVSNTTSVAALAGVIAKVLRDQGVLDLEAVGVLAVNQTAKALAACRSHLAPMGLDAAIQIFFAEVPGSVGDNGRPITMLRFRARRIPG